MKVYPVEIEAVDDANQLVFKVTTQDEHCADIKLKQTTQTPESLEDLFDGLRQAFKLLDLKQ